MKKTFKNRLSHRMKAGFTLIELLVVIAIIGILASVILASLSSARAKGTDAAVKEDLDNARAQAELFYNTAPNSYLGVCAAAGNSATNPGINTILNDAASKIGGGTAVVAVGNPSAYQTVTCHDSATAWAATVSLTSLGGTTATPVFFCVDSSGASKIGTPSGTLTISEGLAPSTYVCP